MAKEYSSESRLWRGASSETCHAKRRRIPENETHVINRM
jgi:hypothetical protein